MYTLIYMEESQATLALWGTVLTAYNTQSGPSTHLVPDLQMNALNQSTFFFLAWRHLLASLHANRHSSCWLVLFTLRCGLFSFRTEETFRVCSQNCEKRLLASLCLSVCPSVRPFACNNSAPIFENLHQNRTRMVGALHEDQYKFLIIPRSIFLRTKKKKHFRQNLSGKWNSILYSMAFLENCAVCERMWRGGGTVKSRAGHMAIWR